ncbi:MAG: FAD:protein FMN transferase [Epsilonproteobacteria bacterium]|nr:FAD:protein FMN transferase [Campylobacterota bacterium]
MRHIYRFSVMTTPCELHLFGDRGRADGVARRVLRGSKGLELKYNFYNPDSLLSKINRREVSRVDQESREILRLAKGYSVRTNGVFDITMGTLKGIERSKSSIELERFREKMLPFIGVEHFKIGRNRIEFDNPYTKIDLGGFVKEYAVDRAVKIIKRGGIDEALINFGGDIYAMGREFHIGIKNPNRRDEIITTIPLKDMALTTSASYERYSEVDGEIFSHIRGKSTLQSEIVSTTVISKSAVESGVFSTALMVEPDMDLDISASILLIRRDLKLIWRSSIYRY